MKSHMRYHEVTGVTAQVRHAIAIRIIALNGATKLKPAGQVSPDLATLLI
jgi:hypothetical protein